MVEPPLLAGFTHATVRDLAETFLNVGALGAVAAAVSVVVIGEEAGPSPCEFVAVTRYL
jgi:hypothetical protein